MRRAVVAAPFAVAAAVALYGCGGSSSPSPSPSPAPTPDLSHSCSDVPLGIAYDIPYYSGKATCGNVLLECDIGGTHPWISPMVTFPEAEAGALYTVMYIDFFVNIENDGSWPDVKTPGSKAPARHWVAGNIDANMLKSGDLSAATQVSPYKGPSPPWGSHPYAQFLFKQPTATEISFETFPDPKVNATAIYNFDYKAFIEKYKLGSPVASNWHVTQHIDPCPTHNVTNSSLSTQKAPKNYPDPPLPIGVSNPPLQAAYDIAYYNGTINDGNLLLENDIGGDHDPPTIHQPKVMYPSAEKGSLYTLIYVDPDANVVTADGQNASWSRVDPPAPGTAAPVRHWVAGNIDSDMLQNGDLSKATQISKYAGPSPPWGSHRYGLFLFKQNGTLTFPPTENKTIQWDYNVFLLEYKLGDPVAKNWHVTQHDVDRPVAQAPKSLEVTV